MEPEIIVFNSENMQIGKTFARRAKQLVAKGRAAWTDEGRMAVVVADVGDFEEVSRDNGGRIIDLRETEDETPKISDDLLRHLARQRVRRRKLLMWNAIAYGAAIPMNLFMLAAFWSVVFSRTDFYLAAGFFLGIMTLWGGWIFVQIAAALREKLRNRYPKPDEVELEFLRLKAGHQ